jgi:hypothetical protein
MIYLIKFAVGVNPIAPPCPFVVKFRMGKNTKDQATVVFRQLSSGEVIGEIIDEKGVVVESKNFGVLSEEEFERVLDFVNENDPKLAGKILPTVKLTGN